MPDFRIRETGEVVSDSEFRLRNKHTSFPRIIDEPLQDQFGIDMIFEGPQKQGPPPYSQTYRDGIEVGPNSSLMIMMAMPLNDVEIANLAAYLEDARYQQPKTNQ